MTTASILTLGIYLALFLSALAGFGLWRIKRRRERPPLEFKLLREPGETLRRRMAKFDEDAIPRIFGAAFAPILVAFLPMLAFDQFKPANWTQLLAWLAIVGLLFVVTLVFAFRWAMKDLMRYRNDRLGYLGERAVGEALRPLAEAGYRIFHDVPAEAGGATFNVDHVVVGPNGVFAIETKTRRKGRARPGFEDHKVAYDGKQLIWPWGEDDFGLQNAQSRARWLADWLNTMTGVRLEAKPVLVLPGWYVVPKGIGSVSVLNHKQLAAAISRSNGACLTPEQIGLVARQLDSRCRDVED